MRELGPLLAPRSVAVIGASGTLDSLPGRPVRNLLAAGTGIEVFPVNPRRNGIGGLRCYPDVAELPVAPDVALILTPAAAVPAAVEAAGRRGTGAAVVISAGFAETGEDGARRQRELADTARAHGMLLLGPNTIGLHDYRRGLPLSFVWTGRTPERTTGAVAVVTQSGSGMASLCDRLLDHDLPLGHGVATGNEADVSVTDLIEHFAEQDDVRVVVTVFEQIRDGERFLAACRRLHALGKPLVALKLGRTASGSSVARSHTGALAGSYPVLRAVLRQHGVLEVDDLEDIGPTVTAALAGRFPAGRRFAVVTSSGGAAVIAADRADELGMELPPFSPAARERIRPYLPDLAAVHNPLDLTAQAMRHRFALADVLAVAQDGDDVDAVLVGTPSGAGDYGLALADRLAEVAAAGDKPVLSFILGGEEGAPQRRRQRDGGLPVFRSPGEAVATLERLSRFRRARPRNLPEPAGAAAHDLPSGAPSEHATLSWLQRCGIATVEQRLARTAEEAIQHAGALDRPVALKISSPDIAHKTEIGGVALDLRDADGVRAAFDAVTGAAARAMPSARLDGVTVSPMVDPVLELIVGVHRDPDLGPVLALGLGGTWTEILHDVALRAVPLDPADVPEMIDELRAAAVLRGARGRPPVDPAALTTLVVTVSRIAWDCGDALTGLDLNPVAITADGAPVVLDALLQLTATGAVSPVVGS
ncbi:MULTISPECIES: acetate--CoA ligase family protein [Pseudonocardia]|uniref:Pimeloyl-CoA synthetase n=1 Tax=Pseudonocardia saturnea TaxID=33909 RepID=A0ABQ0RWM4_9PSEU|nr:MULTISPECIES: acetate--CoA ligase family protein [Pseudonocardia]TDN72303.1 6-carboxyhexanoate-CoA ligase [Pseudonocardia autotrophica]BBG03015.1 pimeloyl-CoA synthetase [Pseudonocardia autotrophica]GEC25083.1 pimeloyl-CoA synthetase [Pseudonocardia saturnea]